MLVKSWAGELKRVKRAHRAPFWLASGSFVIFQLTADYYCHKRGHPKYYIWNLRGWIWNANTEGQSHWGNPLPTFVQYVKIFHFSSMFVCSAVWLSIGLSVCLSLFLSVCPFVFASVPKCCCLRSLLGFLFWRNSKPTRFILLRFTFSLGFSLN